MFTLLRTRDPELGTPRLALSLRLWSIAAHVLSGVVILGTAISEFWIRLDVAGPYLFAIYGAAAAIALLGVEAFHLSFVAEAPPKPPKWATIETEPAEGPELEHSEGKKSKWRFLRRSKGEIGTESTPDDEGTEGAADAPTETAPTVEAPTVEAPTVEAPTVEAPTEAAPIPETQEAVVTAEAEEAAEPQADGGLLNRRPTGKGSHRLSRRRTPSDAATDQ